MKPIIILITPSEPSEEVKNRLTARISPDALLIIIFDPSKESVSVKVIHDANVTITEL